MQPHRAARVAQRVADLCYERFHALRARAPSHPVVVGLAQFREQQHGWLELDTVYEAIAQRAGDDPTAFEPALRSIFETSPEGAARRSAMRATLGPAIERRELLQYLCHAQHAAFRARAHDHGLALWGDMQVGYSVRDRFLRGEAFESSWLLGAPPSRTNPDGQPWGYPLLHPEQLSDPRSPARRLFELRVQKLLAEHDGLRIDHPHGLVCPWVYAADDSDARRAVREGARAYESPNSPHADLARWSIARPSDLNPNAATSYADDWVTQLSAEQIDRYAILFDALLETCRKHGLGPDAIATEVLSTCPYPLARVLERHGFGRFRVTQKANLDDSHDPYRSDRAQPQDWLMLGTHDTPPCFALAEDWLRTGYATKLSHYLAERLIAEPAARSSAAAHFATSAGNLLRASLADLFVSGAQNVYVFVGDLLGETEPFNRAGVVHPDNWIARLPERFEEVYAQRVREGRALDVYGALHWALSAKRISHEPMSPYVQGERS
jgi:4-alpha-glucanotransferase